MAKKAHKKLFLVAGARPNFVKIAALSKAFAKFKKSHPRSSFAYRVINTGQHYDYMMSRSFFRDLNIPKPYLNLGVGSSSHGEQTARIMSRFERVLFRERPDLVVVVGDVNSTMACSLVATKMGILVAHVEAGLRSFDRVMPEEINRLVTDSVSDYLFTSCRDGDRNLIREGIPKRKIHFVGNVMVDSLLANLEKSKRSSIRDRLGLRGPYAVLTLHRPSNVDCQSDFGEIARALEWVQEKIPVVFPIHPRTKKRMKQGKIGKKLTSLGGISCVPPVGYLDFIQLMRGAKLVLTDSGGIQEETNILKIPCITLRDNTERPITIRAGNSFLAGRKSKNIVHLAGRILGERRKKKIRRPPLWDGKSADRIVNILARELGF